MKLTILGAGNMGGAIARGLVRSKALSPSEITVTAAHRTSLKTFADAGYRTSTDNVSSVVGSDMVIVAVKPWLVKTVISQIVEVLDYRNQVIVSVAAGVPSADFLEALGEKKGVKPSLVYVIPNTAAEFCSSMSFVAPVGGVADDVVENVSALFGNLGDVLVTDEKHLGAGTSLASCGIAYALRYMRAAAEGGVELGFKASDAIRIVSQTMFGAVQLVRENGSHPEMEIDKVTTPGGITIKGLNSMEAAGFTNAVIAGLKASK